MDGRIASVSQYLNFGRLRPKCMGMYVEGGHKKIGSAGDRSLGVRGVLTLETSLSSYSDHEAARSIFYLIIHLLFY